MKRSKDFIKRKIGTQYVIVAVGAATKKFNGMISVNSTGSFIWDQLEQSMTMDELVNAIVENYEIDAETATAHATQFVNTLKGVGAIAE
ncbi:MAG: PqqD family protein [Clostridia bacterium]|nr:PqqD family protein [Clostridia bacterium]MBR3863219.1 PqqD family protein [Clostridia bacterium]